MTLTIIIPVYNEENTIADVLRRVYEVTLPGITKELIVVNDGSKDKSDQEVKKFMKTHTHIHYFQHDQNKGKGAAVRTGIEQATGEYVVIQDADLEYDPAFLEVLTRPIVNKKADVVYGTRLDRMPDFSRDERNMLFLVHYLGNRFLSLITSLLYGQWVTDMETCYKLFPRHALQGVVLRSKGFEFEPEITVRLMQKGYRIHELPITTTPRGYEEGKKLHTVRDGIKALMMLVSLKFDSTS